MDLADLKELLLPADPAKLEAMLGYWKAAAAVAAVAFGGVLSVTRWGRNALQSIAHSLPFRFVLKKSHPLKLVPNPRACFWTVGSRGDGRPVMAVHYAGSIANTSDAGDYLLVTCRIRKPRTEGAAALRHPEGPDYRGDFPVRLRSAVPMFANFEIVPPIADKPETIHLDLVFVDHRGDEHLVRDVPFRCDMSPAHFAKAIAP